jgi:diphthamide synthase (EF-2-diphthine--ammonia ligase)
MTAFNAKARADSITHLVFGDLFLEDIRRYREIKLEGSGLTPLFPLWGRPTDLLARQMIEAGFCAYLVCVDPKQLDPGFAGRRFDHAFLEALPPGIDPCGENGEFHSCVVDGPIFEAPIPVVPGEIVTRDGFVFADLIPAPL